MRLRDRLHWIAKNIEQYTATVTSKRLPAPVQPLVLNLGKDVSDLASNGVFSVETEIEETIELNCIPVKTHGLVEVDQCKAARVGDEYTLTISFLMTGKY